MTCIIGLAHEGRVYVGGDSAAADTDGYHVTMRADRKVFVNGPYAMGYSSSFRMGQLLQFAKLPDPPEENFIGDALYRFMCIEFIDAVRARLSEGGFAKKENEVEHGGQFIVGVRGKLFTVYSDYNVQPDSDSFCAVGCGYSYAMGAMGSLPDTMDPRTRIEKALGVVARYSAYVRSPFHIVEAPR